MIWSSKDVRRGSFGPHLHDMHELFISLNEKGVQYIDGNQCEFSRGRAFFLFSGVPHSISCDNETGLEYIFFCFDQDYYLSREMPAMHEQLKRLMLAKNYFSGISPEYLAENVRLSEELYYEINNPGMLSGEKVTALLTCLIANFSRSLASEYDDDIGGDNSNLAQLCKKIRKYPQREYRLERTAETVAMSRSKFAVKFKEYAGVSLMEYVIAFRLKYACKLFSDSDLSVLEVTMQSGFNNAGYFHRQFKKRFGITPLQMKKRYTSTRYPQLLKEY